MQLRRLVMLFFAIALLELGASSAPSIAECDCHALSLAPEPVCGSDGITYINRCVALCQGTAVAQQAACGAGALPVGLPPTVDYSLVDGESTVDASELAAFAARGYHMSAKLFLKSDVADISEGSSDRDASALPAAEGNASTVLSLLVNKWGLLYLKSIPAEEQGEAAEAGAPAASSAGGKPKPRPAVSLPGSGAGVPWEGLLGRKMLLVGQDDRAAVGQAQYPLSAVGFLGINGNTRGCSAALVGRRSVLTAGHCVYDTAARQLYDVGQMAFYPAQNNGSPGRAVAVDHVMTVYNNAGAPVPCGGGGGGDRCQSEEDRRYDFAVVTLEEAVGDEYGFLGLGYSCDTTQYRVDTAGYPGDLPDSPYQMYTARGTLSAFSACDPAIENSVITSDLDTAVGQSGSAIWDEEHVIRAVHVAGAGPLHRAISRWAFNQIMEEVDAHSNSEP